MTISDKQRLDAIEAGRVAVRRTGDGVAWEAIASGADPFDIDNWYVARNFRIAIDSAMKSRVPYPKFCRHPDKCSGLSNCPRDPICAD